MVDESSVEDQLMAIVFVASVEVLEVGVVFDLLEVISADKVVVDGIEAVP